MSPASGASAHLPAGYRESVVRGTRLVATDAAHELLRPVVASGTLHAWAARQPGARALQGRGVAWVAALEGTGEVVVRHSRHGGLLAPLTGDVFLAPSRAPHELDVAIRLRAAGVRTPDVVAFATYAAVGPLCRADVVTAFVPGADLPAAWNAADAGGRVRLADAVGALVAALTRAGAVHADLNVKNVLVCTDAPAAAWVLDVDRVTFGRPDDPAVAARNLARLGRSVEKWQRERGWPFTPDDWARVRDAAQAAGSRS